MLAAHDPCVVQQRLVRATAASVRDAWRLYPHVRDEMRTYMCSSGSGVAVVRSAVDREAANASHAWKCSVETVTYSTHVHRMSETRSMML